MNKHLKYSNSETASYLIVFVALSTKIVLEGFLHFAVLLWNPEICIEILLLKYCYYNHYYR